MYRKAAARFAPAIYIYFPNYYHRLFALMPEKLSIIIPAYNEEERVGSTIRTILEYMDSNGLGDSELIVVDDGSTDRTVDVAKDEFAKNGNVAAKVIDYGQNRGKGYAVRIGLKAASNNIALFSDADLSTPIAELPSLIDPIRSGEYDVTFGSRALDRSLIGTHQPWRREQGGKVMNLIIRVMSGLKFSDTQCGFKAFNMVKFRPLLDTFTIDRFGFDVEFLYVAARHKLRLKEIPVRWDNVEGSKVDVIRDTRRMFAELAEIRTNARKGIYDKV
jgi:dolichyl-phosphate beta-glucosyltransferase